MNQSTVEILKFFKFDHLPEHLKNVSRPFCELAIECAEKYDGPELTAGLRKLLEAKDCIVRAALPKALNIYPSAEISTTVVSITAGVICDDINLFQINS